MKIVKAHSPEWADQEQTKINLMVRFDSIPVEVPFTACPDDATEYGRELFSRAKFGEYGEIAPYSGPTSGDLALLEFSGKKAQEMEKAEARITLLSRAKRLKMASSPELDELKALEVYTIELMRAEGPEIPVFSFAH